MKVTINIEGMHCKSCKMLIEDISEDIEGINSCKVDEKTHKATIDYKTEEALNKLKKEIESAGNYKITQ